MPSASASSTARQRARVTVITRTKDRPVLLRRCVESVLGQTFPDWLHVIVNDGGNPHVLRLLVAEQAARYAGRLEVVDHAISQGMQNASNRGLEAAAGEYVVIHDDDDSWEPDFLRACVEFLDHEGPASDVQGVVTQTTRILEELTDQGGIHEDSREHYLPIKHIDLFAAGSENPFAPIAFVYRRAVHERIGNFDERFTVLGDWDFNLRFLVQHDIGVIDRRLANYHWRHRSGGTVYANTVTDGLDEHHRKTNAMRNYYLRADLQAGRMGLGYLMHTSKMMRAQEGLLWSVRHLSEQAIHEVRKVQNRLVQWQWFVTRNRRLKATLDQGRPAAPARLKAPIKKKAAPQQSCRDALAAFFDGRQPRPRVLSLDVFDTALLRTVRRPVDVFHMLAPAIRRQIGADAGLPIANLRANAERSARARRFAEAGHEEITLLDIYDDFCDQAGVDPAVHRDPLAKIEADIEATLLYPNPAVLAAAATAERAGTRVIFVSDMYLPRGFIVDQLRRVGYAVDKGALFLSAELGASKHVGGLFDVVLRELGCEPHDILHVGDNLHSDVVRAGERGLRTVHWNAAGPGAVADPLPFVDQPPENGASAAFEEDDLLSSVCTGLVRRARTPTTPALPTASANGHSGVGNREWWERLGYEIGGPLYFTFLHWLLKNARREKLDRLFFLARDGHYLRGACEVLAERAGFAIESVEMAASRRLLNLPQVTALDHSSMPFLLTPNPNLRVRHFLTRIGIDPEPLAEKIHRAGFASLDDIITTPGGVFRSEKDHHAMHQLIVSLKDTILASAAAERERMQKYFGQIGFNSDDAHSCAVVDLGWQASSARALQKWLNLQAAASGKQPEPLRAFYFGTWHFAQTAIEAGCRLSSFFFHLDKPPERRALVSESVELIELFFGAPHPTIVGLREETDGRMEPVFGSAEHGDEHSAHIARMRERAVDFVRDAAALAPPGEILEWTGSGIGYLEAALGRFLRRPTLDEARVLGALPARDSFGGDTPTRPLALVPSPWERLIHPSRLRHAFQHAFWKKGFLAQLTPRETARVEAAG